MKHFAGRFLGALIFLLTIALFGLAAMFLWNALLPGIFGLPVINYWQAAGLLLLARIIFGGYGKIGMGIAQGFHGHNNPFRDKWHGMSEADRELFLKKRRHGHHAAEDTAKNDETQKE
jgi:hypothetical protein